MKYLLDTNVCIKILKGSSDNIRKRLTNVDINEIAIPSIVRFELYYGAYKSIRRDETMSILNDFLYSFKELDFNNKVSKIAGKIRADLESKGIPVGPYDVLIGASALSEGLVLVTHNTKEFSRINDLIIEDWEM